MVYMSGSRNARYSSSICNRTNVCGGPKKSGTGPTVGWWLTSNPGIRGAPKSLPLSCIANTSVQTQKYGYSATHGGNMG
jgi:hypothetical protein